MYIKPAEDRKVRDPQTKRHVPAEGAEVPESSYWLRRVKDGDVLVANPAAGQADPEDPKSQPARSAKRGSKE